MLQYTKREALVQRLGIDRIEVTIILETWLKKPNAIGLVCWKTIIQYRRFCHSTGGLLGTPFCPGPSRCCQCSPKAIDMRCPKLSNSHLRLVRYCCQKTPTRDPKISIIHPINIDKRDFLSQQIPIHVHHSYLRSRFLYFRYIFIIPN